MHRVQGDSLVDLSPADPRDFTLDDATSIVGYLRELGAGAVYLSPVLQSTSGSEHGYDTVDPSQIDKDRGGEAAGRLIEAARDAGLGVVVDIVPNHLGISAPVENPAWWDVLRRAGFGVRELVRHRLEPRADRAAGAG